MSGARSGARCRRRPLEPCRARGARHRAATLTRRWPTQTHAAVITCRNRAVSNGDLIHVVADQRHLGPRKRAWALCDGRSVLLVVLALQMLDATGHRLTSASRTGGRRSMPTSCGRVPVRRPGADPRRAGQARAVRAAGGCCSSIADGDLPDCCSASPSRFTDWNLVSSTGRKFNGLDKSGRCWATRSTGTRCGNMVCMCWRSLVEIRHRLRPGAAAQRPDPGTKVLPRRRSCCP